MFAVERISVPGVIGFCGLVHPNNQLVAEHKICIQPSFLGNGLCY
jgi:RimJ/RimL family protein N-acetyltransferase